MQQSALTILPSRRSGSHCELERPWPGAIRTIFHNTVTSATRLFKSIALDTNDSYSFTFTEPGTYEYFCSLHPRMTGTIVVGVDKTLLRWRNIAVAICAYSENKATARTHH
jgi:copper binding plastocyanin/azurin family protein